MTKESNNSQGDKPSKPTFRGEVAKSLASRRKRKENASQAKVARAAKEKKSSKEFWLVLAMLLTLTLLVIAVLLIPPSLIAVDLSAEGATDLDVLERVIEYRRTVLAVIVTAFGAWVGAGAAYFFGRENLREATNAILQSRGKTAMEKLRETSVREIPPLPLDWRPRIDWKLKQIDEVLCKKPDFWFIPVFDDDDGLVTVLDEEAFWRYLARKGKRRTESDGSTPSVKKKPDESTDGKAASGEHMSGPEATDKETESEEQDMLKKELSDLVTFVEEDPNLAKAFLDPFVKCTMEQSAADAYRRMQTEGRDVRLAIVLNDEGKATHFFTTTQVRRMLLDIV